MMLPPMSVIGSACAAELPNSLPAMKLIGIVRLVIPALTVNGTLTKRALFDAVTGLCASSAKRIVCGSTRRESERVAAGNQSTTTWLLGEREAKRLAWIGRLECDIDRHEVVRRSREMRTG